MSYVAVGDVSLWTSAITKKLVSTAPTMTTLLSEPTRATTTTATTEERAAPVTTTSTAPTTTESRSEPIATTSSTSLTRDSLLKTLTSPTATTTATKTPPPPPPPPPPPVTQEVLMSAVPVSAPAVEDIYAPLDVPSEDNKTAMYVGLGLVAAAAIAGGWFLFARKKKRNA